MPNLSILQTQGMLPQPGISANPAGAAAGFANDVENLAGQAAHLYQQHQDDQARVWAGNAISDFHLKQLQGIQAQRDAVAQGVAQGQPVPDMTGNFLKDFDDQAGKLVSSAPTEQAKTYMSEQLASARESLGAQMIGQQAQLTRDWKRTSWTTSAESAGKIVQQDPSQFDAQMGNLVATMPHFEPQEDQQRLLAAKESLTNAAAGSALDRDPYGLKAATGKALGEGGYSGPTNVAWIDMAKPEQVKVWNRLAEERIRQIENAKATDQNAREIAAAAEHNKLADMINRGEVPSLDYITQLRSITAGTSVADDSERLIKVGTSGNGFGSQSLPAQSRILEALDAQFAAGGTSPDASATRAQLEKINSTQQAAYKEDPLDAAARFAHVPVIPLQDVSSTSQALDLVTQRMPGLTTVEAAAGAPASPLHPAEAQKLGKLLRAMQPDQAATAMSQLGAAIGDAQRIAAVSKQLGDTDGTMGLAMAYAGNLTTKGRAVSELLLRGDQALQDKRTETQVQKQEAWKDAAAKSIRGAFSDVTLENKAIDAAIKINAATALSGQDDMDAAVRMATGGITTHGAAEAKIPLPYGMTPDDFEKKLAALKPTNFAQQVPDGVVHIGAATMPLQQFVDGLHDATLVHAGQGQYNVRGGTTLATNAQGQRILIRIGP